jgi:hypothetical protein
MARGKELFKLLRMQILRKIFLKALVVHPLQLILLPPNQS